MYKYPLDVCTVYGYTVLVMANGSGNGGENGSVVGSNNRSTNANINTNHSHSGEQRGGETKRQGSLSRVGTLTVLIFTFSKGKYPFTALFPSFRVIFTYFHLFSLFY